HPELDQLRDKHPNRLHVLQLEGTNYNSFPEFVKQVEAIVGDQGLDTLINNAGMAFRDRLDSVTAEVMVKNFEVNSVAPLMLTKALLPLLKGTDYHCFPEFVKQVEAIVGDNGIDTLINNAGILLPKLLDSVTAEDMLKNFEVNSVAPLMLTKALLPLLKTSAASRKTSVINISSSLGSIELATRPGMTIYPYRTSKAALNMITKCLAVDLKPHNIHVISICPGHLKTDLGGPTAQLEVSTGVSGVLNVIKTQITDDVLGANRGIGLELVRQVLTTTHAKHVIATTRQSSHPELDQLRDKHPNRLHVLQ
ncbi:unnamed protein product, partial [Oppiella nova]